MSITDTMLQIVQYFNSFLPIIGIGVGFAVASGIAKIFYDAIRPEPYQFTATEQPKEIITMTERPAPPPPPAPPKPKKKLVDVWVCDYCGNPHYRFPRNSRCTGCGGRLTYMRQEVA